MRDEVVARRVAKRLRELRNSRKTSLRALAKQSGLRVEVVSRLLRGKHTPSVGSLARLCVGLGVSFSEFFTDAGLDAVTAVSGPGAVSLTSDDGAAEDEAIVIRLQRVLDPLSDEARNLVVSAIETLARGYTPGSPAPLATRPASSRRGRRS